MSERNCHPLPAGSWPPPSLRSPWWWNSLRRLGRRWKTNSRGTSTANSRGRVRWPIGLRLLFWYVVFGVSVGFGQLVFRFIEGGIGFSGNSTLGIYVAATFPLEIVSIVAGAFRQRRLFAATALLAGALHVGFVSFFNWEFYGAQLDDFLAGRRVIPHFGDGITWYVTWNWFCIATNALAVLYLVRYEFRFFRKIRRLQPHGMLTK